MLQSNLFCCCRDRRFEEARKLGFVPRDTDTDIKYEKLDNNSNSNSLRKKSDDVPMFDFQYTSNMEKNESGVKSATDVGVHPNSEDLCKVSESTVCTNTTTKRLPSITEIDETSADNVKSLEVTEPNLLSKQKPDTTLDNVDFEEILF